MHLMTALVAANLGLYYSVISSKAYVATIRCYFAMLLIWLVAPMIIFAIPFFWGSNWNLILPKGSVFDFFAASNPFMLASSRPPISVLSGWLQIDQIYLYAVLCFVASRYLFLKSTRVLRKSFGREQIPRIWCWMARSYSGVVAALTDGLERRRKHRIWKKLWVWEQQSRTWGNLERRYGLDINPLIYRGAAANVYDPERYVGGLQLLGWVGVIGFVLLAIPFAPSLLYTASIFQWLFWAELPLFFTVLCVLGSTSIARERSRGTFDLLRMTGITPWQYLAGTWWGIARCSFPITLLVAITALAGGLASLQDEAVLIWALTVPSMVVALVAGSLLVSVVFTRTGPAVTAGLLAPLVLFGSSAVVPLIPRSVWLVVGACGLSITLSVYYCLKRVLTPVIAVSMATLVPATLLLCVFYFWGGTSRLGPLSFASYTRWFVEPLTTYRRHGGWGGAPFGGPVGSAIAFTLCNWLAAGLLGRLTLRSLRSMFRTDLIASTRPRFVSPLAHGRRTKFSASRIQQHP